MVSPLVDNRYAQSIERCSVERFGRNVHLDAPLDVGGSVQPGYETR
jgi:hypothetical protein